MKTARLMGILTDLLVSDEYTAAKLAEKYEVSTRTIYRDIQALSEGGIPLYAQPGEGGGIRLMEGYVLPRVLLSEGERALLHGMLAKFPEASEAESLKRKLVQRDHAPVEWLHVDLNGWDGGEDLGPFPLCDQAIQQSRLLRFRYAGSGRKLPEERTVEAMTLLFRGGNWYLWGWCRLRNEYRLFRLSRMRDCELLDAFFVRRPDTFREWDRSDMHAQGTILRLRFPIEQIARVYEVFASGNTSLDADGSLRVTVRWRLDSWVIGTLLSFGAAVYVEEPTWFREVLRDMAQGALRAHGGGAGETQRIHTETENVSIEKERYHMQATDFCQSCAMPLTDADRGTEKDGSPSADYCKYCYQDGAFVGGEQTMEQAIESCIPFVSDGNPYPNAEAARAAMLEYFPKMKRWQK